MTSIEYNTYRTLRAQTKTEDYWIDNIGTIIFGSGQYSGNNNVVEIVSVTDPQKGKFKKGDKTTIAKFFEEGKMANYEYTVSTPGNGYSIEFATCDGGTMFIGQKIKHSRFGILLPNSKVRIASNSVMRIEYGAVGWDDEFLAASDLDEFMLYIAKKVDYNFVKKNIDNLQKNYKWNNNKCPIDATNCPCKGNLDEHLIINVSGGAGLWGAIWGLAPPWLLPAEFVNVLAQFTAQAHLAAAIGYSHGYYPKSGDEFVQQLKLDNYVLFAGMDSGSNKIGRAHV
jgi:hypothetical protein